MGRTIRFNDAANSFRQGLSIDNREVTLIMLGGNDRVLLDRNDDFGGGNEVRAGAGNDVVRSLAENGSLILLGDGRDTYIGEGFGSFATDRADTVRGGAGADTIAAATFKSIYTGDAGNDRFFSVGWQNTFLGGRGIDTISYQVRDNDSTQGGSGVTVDLGAGKAQTGANRFETLRGIENVVGSGADDALFGHGGRNRLTGGDGFDQMTGRGGADTFVWRSATEAQAASDAIDIVTDFRADQGDKLHLSAIDANLNAAGNQDFRFIGGAEFSGRAGELRFSDQILAADLNGDGFADMQIGLANVASLRAIDILL